MSSIDLAGPPPSLIQQYLRGQHEGSGVAADSKNPSSLLSSLVATLSSPRESRDDDAVIRAISTDLASLRWLSHALAENKEVKKAKVAEMKQTVDEARLKLENARLEERELREEIRREEAE